MSPSVVAAPEWITTSSGCDMFASANAAVTFPPGTGSVGGLDMAKRGRAKSVKQRKSTNRFAIRLITCRNGIKTGLNH